MTDHVFFIHGVNVEQPTTIPPLPPTAPPPPHNPTYSNTLKQLITDQASKSSQELLPIKFLPLYWYHITKPQEQNLSGLLGTSKAWKNMWFRDLRQTFLLHFAGDAALYLSQHIAAQAIESMFNQIIAYEQNNPLSNDDNIHIVSHSWGTVILFDILFGARWDDTLATNSCYNNDPSMTTAIEKVAQIRNKFYGMGKDKDVGIEISGINTMGSPLAFYSLLLSNVGSLHDISGNLKTFLSIMDSRRKSKGLPTLKWENFIHRGDLIAYPLENVLPNLLDGSALFINIKDTITVPDDLWQNIWKFTNQNIMTAAIVTAFDGAHNSYWKSDLVAGNIASKFR
jgi:hypothetical protein